MNKLVITLLGLGGIILTLILVFVISFGMRWFNSATIQAQIIQPKENVECIVVSTTDGAAVDCWKVDL